MLSVLQGIIDYYIPPDDLDRLIESYNLGNESKDAHDRKISEMLLDQALGKLVLESSLIVEAGSYRGNTLAAISDFVSDDETIVAGLDAGHYTVFTHNSSFQKMNLKEFEKCAANYSGPEKNRQFLEELAKNIRSQDPKYISISRNKSRQNTFSVVGLPAEQVVPSIPADLAIFKCMLGYMNLGQIAGVSAEKRFVFDYLGHCSFTGTNVPNPQTVADTLKLNTIEKGKKYFVVY